MTSNPYDKSKSSKSSSAAAALDIFSTNSSTSSSKKQAAAADNSSSDSETERRRQRRAEREKEKRRKEKEQRRQEEQQDSEEDEKNRKRESRRRKSPSSSEEDERPRSKREQAIAKQRDEQTTTANTTAAHQVSNRIQSQAIHRQNNPNSSAVNQQRHSINRAASQASYNNPHLTGPPPPSVPYGTFEAVKNELHDKCILLSVAGASIAKQTQLITSLKTECEEHKQQRIHAETQLNIIEHERKQLQKVIEYQRTQLTEQAKQLQLRVLPKHMSEHANDNRQYAAQIQQLNSNSTTTTAQLTGGQAQSVEEEVKQLRLVTHHFKQVIDDHESNIARTKKENEHLTGIINRQKKEIQLLQSYSQRIKEQDNQIHNLNQTVQQLEHVKSELEEEVEEIADSYKERRAKWKKEKKELIDKLKEHESQQSNHTTAAPLGKTAINELDDIISSFAPTPAQQQNTKSDKSRKLQSHHTDSLQQATDNNKTSKSKSNANKLFDMDVFNTDLDQFNTQSQNLTSAINQSLHHSNDEEAKRLKHKAKRPTDSENEQGEERKQRDPSSNSNKRDLDDLLPDLMNAKI